MKDIQQHSALSHVLHVNQRLGMKYHFFLLISVFLLIHPPILFAQKVPKDVQTVLLKPKDELVLVMESSGCFHHKEERLSFQRDSLLVSMRLKRYGEAHDCLLPYSFFRDSVSTLLSSLTRQEDGDCESTTTITYRSFLNGKPLWMRNDPWTIVPEHLIVEGCCYLQYCEEDEILYHWFESLSSHVQQRKDRAPKMRTKAARPTIPLSQEE